VARNIIASERMFRLGTATDCVMLAGGIVLIWSLYVLLRPVHRDLALLAVLLRVVETAVTVSATIASLIAVRLLSGREYLDVFEAGQLHALSRLARNAFGLGQDVGFVFLGMGSAIFAYLLLRSRYVPRILAGWGVFASLLLAASNLVFFVFPGVAGTLLYASLAPIGIYEMTIGFWLLLRGARLSAG
jgi:hypothetical protein